MAYVCSRREWAQWFKVTVEFLCPMASENVFTSMLHTIASPRKDFPQAENDCAPFAEMCAPARETGASYEGA